jgi:catechol 2,3-dioxygenase-like lactoylglutathione lyase family enzyme
MPAQNPMMVGAATVFVVSNIGRSIEHYRDVLGFTVTFQYGNPTFYVCLCRDEVALHLLAAHETKRIPGNGGICVFVTDVDAVHADLEHIPLTFTCSLCERKSWHIPSR